MNKKWSITSQEIADANGYVEIICSELNVKQFKLSVGKNDKGQTVEVIYHHDTLTDSAGLLLDVYVDNEPQSRYDFAAWLFFNMFFYPKKRNNAEV